MSQYLTDVKPATCRIEKRNAQTLAEVLKAAAKNHAYDHYGWQSSMINAETLDDIAQIFDIKLIDEGDDLRPMLKNTYYSDFFRDISTFIAPFVTNGQIVVHNNENREIKLTYRNHVLIDRSIY